MNDIAPVTHTARTHTVGGRQHGVSRSLDGQLDIRLAAPGSGRIGTNPEQLFAAAWSACFETAIELVAKERQITLPDGITIDAEVTLNATNESYTLSAQFHVELAGVERETALALIAEAHTTCPYSRAMRGNVEITTTLAN